MELAAPMRETSISEMADEPTRARDHDRVGVACSVRGRDALELSEIVELGGFGRDHQPATTRFVRRPTCSTSAVITSPGAMNSGGSRKYPIPPGVPVEITSPG